MPENAIVPFTFEGDSLDVVRLPDGDVGVSVRRLCDAVGLNPQAQVRRLEREAENGARWATAAVMAAVAADGKTRDVVVLPRRSIPMWAATVDTRKARPEVRAKLVRYQDAAADALAAAFLAPAAPVVSPADAKLDKLLEAVAGLTGAVAAMLARPAQAPARRPLPPPASLPLPFEIQAPALDCRAALPAPTILIPADWLTAQSIAAVLTDRTHERVTDRRVNAAIRELGAIRRDPALARARPKVTRDEYGNEQSNPQWFYGPAVVDVVHRHLAGLTSAPVAVASSSKG